jgi:hydrogenase expression/formation protein HypC
MGHVAPSGTLLVSTPAHELVPAEVRYRFLQRTVETGQSAAYRICLMLTFDINKRKLKFMCLALPAQVITINPDTAMATVSVNNVKVEVSLALVDDVSVGDYVLVHVGYALNKIDEDEAMKTLALFAEAGLSSSP